MQTVQKLVQNSVITSFLVTDFIQDQSTIQVIMVIAVLLVVIRKETYALMRKESDNFAVRRIQTRAMVNNQPRSFQFFSARAEKVTSTLLET